MAVSNLGSETWRNAATFSSANSYAFANDRLYLCHVLLRCPTGTPISVTSITGGGLTWVLEETTQVGTETNVIETWRAQVPSGATTDNLDFVVTSDPVRAVFVLDEYTGVPTTGTNGSAAIVQSVISATTAESNITVTLAGFLNDASNYAVGIFYHRANETSTVGSGFTALANTTFGGATGPVSALSEYKVGEDLTVDASWATHSPACAIAFEILQPPSFTIPDIVDMSLTVEAPTIANTSNTVDLDGPFQGDAFQIDAFQGDAFISMALEVFTPELGDVVTLPTFVSEGFQPGAFQQNAFQAGNSGLYMPLTIYAPSIVSDDAAPVTIYLAQGAVWNDNNVVWNDPDVAWNETGSGLFEMLLQVFTPEQVLRATPPQILFDIEFLAGGLTVYSPTVFDLNNPLVVEPGALQARYSPSISLGAVESTTINLEARADP